MPETVGRYEMLERVGRGGMGVVYRARDPRLDRIVAVKLLPADLDIDETTRQRFMREAMSAARLQHRNIVTVFEFAEDPDQGTPYIVMEFLQGRSLAARLVQEPPLTIEQSLDVVIQLCTGLDYAHEQGVVHRDVKPGNIWLQDDGAVKLLDFGIARVAASTLTRHGEVVGSASYTAPEQIRGLPVDGRADVFSAGVVLFELLAGRRPFEAESPTAIINLLLDEAPAPVDVLPPSVPPAVREAVTRALQKNPDLRYARASEFAADLQIAVLELGDTLVHDGSTTVVVLDDPAKTIYAPPPLREPAAPRASAPLDLPYRSAPLPQPVPPMGTTRSRKTLLAFAAVAAGVILVATGWAVRGRSNGQEPPPQPTDAPAVETKAPEPAPPPPAPVEIQVGSVPAKATILRDGKDTGLRTPAKVALADVRAGTLQLTLAGYVPHGVAAADVPEGATQVTLKLRPVDTPVIVTLRAPYAVRVTVGNRSLGPATEIQFPINGRQSFKVSQPDFFLERTYHVDPRDGARQSFAVPPLGTIDVRTRFESCTVSINGREVGYQPVTERVASGTVIVRLIRCPDGQQRQEEVTLRPGDTPQRITIK